MATLRAAEGDLARALKTLEPRTPYAEVMAEVSEGERLRHDRSATIPDPLPWLSGAVFRAWTGERWVEAAVSGLEPSALRETVRGLAEGLRGDHASRAPPGDSPSGSAERATVVRRPSSELALEERLELAKRYFGWATAVPGVSNAVVTIETRRDERLFLSTAGAHRWQRVDRTAGSLAAIAIEGGRVEYDFVGNGETAGLEALDYLTEERIAAAGREATALLKARAPPTGRLAVLLDPSTSGTFAHESFGHGTEADQILRNRSYLAPILGSKVGPESLTLVDDGSFDRGWGSIYFDDEGHPSQRTVMVDRGLFVEVLHDRESAAALGRRPTGNTRRADFLSRPFVRMTNTFVEPGDLTLEELLEEMKDGVLLENCTSGIEDPLGGNMQIKVKKAHRVAHGETAELFGSMALSGKVLEFLKAIRGVGRRTDFHMSPGYCGKGHTDLLPAGTGGTYLLSEAVVGPA